MKIVKFCLFFFAFSLLLISCETDFETNAAWKDITVVYGLLDQRDSVQYIKINKAFLGEGDALMFAKINDSINYNPPLNVWIEEWDADGNKLQTIVFDTSTTYKPDDPDAVFNTGAQRIYKGKPASYYEIRPIIEGPNIVGYDTIWLNDKSTYKLKIVYPDSSKTVTSETILVQDFKITRPFPGSTSIKFVPNPANTSTFSWKEAPNDMDDKFLYELKIIFYYQEMTFDSVLTEKSLLLASGTVYPQSGSDELFFYYKDNNFFSTCENEIPYDDPATEGNIKVRYTQYVEFTVSSAAAEYNLFMQVYQPSTSIVQEKPTYTNIENGIGVFSARYYTQERKPLHTETVADLQEIDDNVLKIEY
jgi:hypothetical protein